MSLKRMEHTERHNCNVAGFKVPESYFKNLDKTIPPTSILKAKANTSGFSVPKTYFNSFEDHVLQTLSAKKQTKVRPLFNKKSLVYVTSIAATIILLFTLTTNKTNTTWNTLDVEAVESYILLEDIDTYEIAAQLPEDNLLETNFVNLDFNEQTIETYLLNNTDIEDLIIEEN